jgi:hypothetical protein
MKTVWISYCMAWFVTGAIVYLIISMGNSPWWSLLLLIPAGISYSEKDNGDKENQEKTGL